MRSPILDLRRGATITRQPKAHNSKQIFAFPRLHGILLLNTDALNGSSKNLACKQTFLVY